MSALYKRIDSSYYWWTSYYQGKRIKKSTKMKQRRHAEKIQRMWDVQLLNNDLSFLGQKYISKSDSLEMRILISEFLKLRQRKSVNTYKTATGVLKRFQLFLNENDIHTLQDITLENLNDYIDWLDVSPKTIKNHFIVIRLMMDFAVKSEYIEKNYAKSVTLPTIHHQDLHRNLTDEDINAIFSNPGDWELYYKFLYYTGLRAGDVALLKYSDINREAKSITSFIRKSDRKHEFPISDVLLELIPESNDDLPIFPKLYCKDPQKVNDRIATPRKQLQRVLKKAGIKKATLHSFRTTFNNKLRDLGLQIEDRQILLAQSASETTKIYTHPNFELAKEYINKIPKIL